MVCQKFVDIYFPGCDFLASFSPRLFVIEQVRIVGRTENGSCARCNNPAGKFVNKCAGTPYRREACSAVVTERLVAEVKVSKTGRILPVKWLKELDLDF